MNIRNLTKKIAPLAVVLSLAVPSTEQAAENFGIALYSTFNPENNYPVYVTVKKQIRLVEVYML